MSAAFMRMHECGVMGRPGGLAELHTFAMHFAVVCLIEAKWATPLQFRRSRETARSTAQLIRAYVDHLKEESLYAYVSSVVALADARGGVALHFIGCVLAIQW